MKKDFILIFIFFIDCSMAIDSAHKARQIKTRPKIHFEINQNNSMKSELLAEFLSLKTQEHAEKISLVQVPEFQMIYESQLKICNSFKSHSFSNMHNTNETVETSHDTLTHSSIKLGSSSCQLEHYSVEVSYLPAPVCPWHWLIVKRNDMFPFTRVIAKCNCVTCQAKTIYDSDMMRMSSCNPVYILTPALVKDTLVMNGTEKWTFCMEKVLFSCVCSIRLNPKH